MEGLQLAILGAVFVAVVALTLFGIQRGEALINVQRRLRSESPGRAPRGSSPAIVKNQGVTNPILAWVQASTSIKELKDRDQLRRDLIRAGFDHPAAPVWFVIIRFVLAIALPIAYLLSQTLSSTPTTGAKLIVIALAYCATGLIGPRAIVDRRGNARKTTLQNEFPDALDLMVVCVEAGLGLESAFVRVGSEVTESHPRISEEFNAVSDELRAGRTRAEALRNLGERTDVPALRSFSALLIQTDALGTSIAQTLRTYSLEMRQDRFLKAEEKAMRIPVLMTVPLVACILPVVVTALMLPAIIGVVRDLLPALRGTGG